MDAVKAADLKASIEQRRFVLPKIMNKHVLKKLLKDCNYQAVGAYFKFEPKFIRVGGTRMFDWNSAPAPMIDMLNRTVYQERRAKMANSISGTTRNRQRFFENQGGLCHYCGRITLFEKWTLDHKTPRSRGGKGRWIGNKIGCCSACNGAKGSMTVDEFLETDYLPQERREALGCVGPPITAYLEAKRLSDQLASGKLRLYE